MQTLHGSIVIGGILVNDDPWLSFLHRTVANPSILDINSRYWNISEYIKGNRDVTISRGN